MSPSPASPTEGDDLCETDVTNVAIHSVALLICLCGLAGNGAVICLLWSHCSDWKCPTRCICILNFIDFFFLLFLLPSTLVFLLEDVSCSVIMPLDYVLFVSQLPLVSYSMWLYTLTLISIHRCRSILCPLWHCCLCHQDSLWWDVCAVIWISFIPAFTVIVIVVCPSHLSDFCRVSLLSMYAVDLLLFSPLMLISSTILYIKVKSGSHPQQSKTLYMVFCLIVLFTLPFSLWKFMQLLGYTILSPQLGFLLACIHSTIKPFIYFLVGSSWRPCSVGSLRLSLQRIFQEPEENPAGIDDSAMDAVL